MDRFKSLLKNGYFPQQMPPPFTTAKFAQYRRVLFRALNPYEKKGKNTVCSVPTTNGERFSQARTGHRRRPLTISHPISQICIAKEISDNWREISSQQRKSRLSVSKTKISEFGKRATALPKLSDLRNMRLEMSAGYQFILVSDALQFFPTTYTHSIPWALHTKSIAKKNRSYGVGALTGNNLDYWVRQGQSGQTIGIPIGPDTSHIISEIIGTAIHLQIREDLGAWPAGYRNVDDFFLCFSSLQEAEKALAAIVSGLAEFELQINPDKTRIVPVAEYRDEDWVHRLEQKDINNVWDLGGDQASTQRKQIVDFFEYVLELAMQYDDESVIKFALKKTTTCIIHEDNWKLYSAYVARFATVYPNNIETASLIFITYKSMGYSLDVSVIERIVNATICHHAPINHHSEVSWSLWLAKEFNIRLPVATVNALGNTRSSICALLALHMENLGLLQRRLNKDYWRPLMSQDGLMGPHWLLVYQAARLGWIPAPKTLLRSKAFFREMDNRNIDFYDVQAKTKPLIRRTRINDLREFLEEDYAHRDDEFAYEISDELADYID